MKSYFLLIACIFLSVTSCLGCCPENYICADSNTTGCNNGECSNCQLEYYCTYKKENGVWFQQENKCREGLNDWFEWSNPLNICDKRTCEGSNGAICKHSCRDGPNGYFLITVSFGIAVLAFMVQFYSYWKYVKFDGNVISIFTYTLSIAIWSSAFGFLFFLCLLYVIIIIAIIILTKGAFKAGDLKCDCCDTCLKNFDPLFLYNGKLVKEESVDVKNWKIPENPVREERVFEMYRD